MEYVADTAERVIVKADLARNHAILHSCDNLTIFFFTVKCSLPYSYVIKKDKSCLLMVNNFSCSTSGDHAEGGAGRLEPLHPPNFFSKIKIN